MRAVLALMSCVLFCLGLSACAGAGRGATTPSTSMKLPRPELKIDAELDSDSYPGEADNDNNHVYGHAANTTQTRVVTALVKHYYRAAAARDGARACSMIYSVLAESVPEDLGGPSGGSSPHGVTCAAVMSRLFEHNHARLVVDNATLRVTAVRIRGNHGSVLMSFGARRSTFYMGLHRERGLWKIDRLLASEQPIYVE